MGKRYWAGVGEAIITHSCMYMLVSLFIINTTVLLGRLTGHLDTSLIVIFTFTLVMSIIGVVVGNRIYSI